MKRILLLLLLAVSGMMQAQIVNIPDTVLKNALVASGPGTSSYVTARNSTDNVISIDANDDGDIQLSEALAVWSLNIYDLDIQSISGLENFTNLRKLWIRRTLLTSIDFTPYVNLIDINCGSSSLESVFLNSINVSGLYNLERLSCSVNNITSLDLSGLTALNYLHCGENELTALDLQNQVNLLSLYCPENNISSIDLTGLPLLQELYIYDNPLTALDLTGNPNLKLLQCMSTEIQALDISSCAALEEANFSYNDNLVSVTIGNLQHLTDIDCSMTAISEIDLSACPALDSFAAASAEQLRYVNIKNGPHVISYFDTYSNDYDRFLCIDEGEEQYLPNYILNSDININSYCSFTPGGDYNVITGSLFFDNEGDGCDTNDTVISNIKLNINDGTESGSTISTVGLYDFYTQAGTFTITPDFDNEMFTITPPFAEINFTIVDSLVTAQNFCLTPNGNHPDLDIVIVPFGAQPGFDASYKIVYRNKGNQMLSGSVVLAYQEDVLDFVSANPSEDSSAPGTLTWNYIDLAPFQQREIYVTLNVNSPMEIPAVNIDDQLGFTATINPVSGDDTPDDNIFTLNQVVIGSLDPNDITCLEGHSVNPDKIGEYLHYNINFENTGTAPATFIVVKDVIDTAQFDMASLQLINASHPVQAKVTGNKVEFRFDAINLGPEEKGNVIFKIKTLNTLQANDDVTQQADIFFDYNWPIATNDATTVFEVLSRGDFEKDNSVKVYPNPSNGIVNITAASVVKSIELYDVQGRLLQAGSNASLDISGRASGIYFIKVFTEKGIKVEKIVKN